jgi:pyrroline-5-carboxylate reductase
VPARRKRKASLILLVGAGRMGSALVKGWIAQGIRRIAAVEPKPGESLVALAQANRIGLFKSVDEIAEAAVAACVVALKPQVLRTEAIRLRPIAQTGALMLSIAAGTDIATLRKAWRRASIVRAMPNLPGAIGKGITALYAPPNVRPEQRALAERLMAGLGTTVWARRESWIDTVTAISGSGPAYVFLFAEALAAAAREHGLPAAMAEQLVRATVSGAGALLDADPRQPSILRADVTSPGGTTEAALSVLTKHGAFERLVREAVAAARRRAEELRQLG